MNTIEIIQTIILVLALIFAVGAYIRAYLIEMRFYSSNETIAGWVRAINKRINDLYASQTQTGQNLSFEDLDEEIYTEETKTA